MICTVAWQPLRAVFRTVPEPQDPAEGPEGLHPGWVRSAAAEARAQPAGTLGPAVGGARGAAVSLARVQMGIREAQTSQTGLAR